MKANTTTQFNKTNSFIVNINNNNINNRFRTFGTQTSANAFKNYKTQNKSALFASSFLKTKTFNVNNEKLIFSSFITRKNTTQTTSNFKGGEEPIPLPPVSATSKNENVRVLRPGESISFEELGPIVIREDGSMGRLETWADLTPHERENILKVVTLRNKQRREHLQLQLDSHANNIIHSADNSANTNYNNNDNNTTENNNENENENERNNLNKMSGERKKEAAAREQQTVDEENASKENKVPPPSGGPGGFDPDFVMQLGRLNHVAIAVPDLSSATSLYRDILGAKCSPPLELPEHGVTTVFVDLGNTKLELLAVLGDKSPIANFLQKNPKGGIHHICIEVKDIYKALAHVEKQGLVSLDKQPKIGAHGKPVIFIHPKSVNGVLLELEQE